MDGKSVVLSKEILDSILERAADEVFVLNPDGSIKYVNHSTLARRNFTLDEMLQLRVWDWNTFVTEDSWKRRWESLIKIQRARFETRHIDKHGKSFPVDIQAHYIRFGESEYCVCFVNDISELAEKVFELGRKHEELAEAKRKADDAVNELKSLHDRRSLLFATVAHELRTPIAAISMFCSDESDESWIEARAHIKTLTRDLLHTLDDMRRLTRDSHRREVTFESFTLASLLESVRLSVSAYITRFNLAFNVRMADGLLDAGNCHLYGDLYRLKVVLANLVKNACVHSGGSSIRIEVDTIEAADNSINLRFAVADDGKGIPDEEVDSLFSPFERGKADADGSGLGLNIARSWIEELGGTLENVPSAKGARFEVKIELKRAAQLRPSDSEPISSTTLSEAVPQTDPSKLSVLFVEDDLMIQMVGTKLLSKLFGKVEIAGDGLQAVAKLESQNFDLVLTDYFMPNMNGLELIRQLRSTGYKGVIYACSAATLGSEFDDLVSAGANDVFSKPLTMNKLMACLENDAEIFRQAAVV